MEPDNAEPNELMVDIVPKFTTMLPEYEEDDTDYLSDAEQGQVRFTLQTE